MKLPCVVVCLGLSWSTRLLAEPSEAAATKGSAAEPAPETEDANTRAVMLGQQALEAFDRADWKTAFETFAAAERASHSPVFVLFMARSRSRQGKLLHARALYRAVASETLEESAPESWRNAVRDAESELSALAAQISRLDVFIENTTAHGLELGVDGNPVEHQAGRVHVELDPGAHRLSARRSDGRVEERDVVIGEGQVLAIRIHFPEPVRATAARAPAPEPPPTRFPSYAAYVAGGVGVAGLAFGIVEGVLALVKKAEIERNCVGNSCLASDEGKGEELTQHANLATIGFAVGGVGLALGAAFFYVNRAPTSSTSGANALMVGARGAF